MSRYLFLTLFFVVAVFIGCSDDNTECLDGAPCKATCSDSSDCNPGGTCQANQCTYQICQPGELACDGATVVTCSPDGKVFNPTHLCPDGVCVDGACPCELDGSCTCTGGVDVCGCVTQSDCEDGERCDSVEVCDGDDCQTRNVCRPACEGEVCGIIGELCCVGDTPVCGPSGACSQDCGDAELCGDNFDVCCPAGDVCVFGECRTPGATCESFTECDWGEYCDPGLKQCLPDDFPDDIICRLQGDFEQFDVQQKWSWEEADIISIPVVGDVTGDGQPNVVVNTTIVNNWMTGEIVVLDSAGTEIRRLPHAPDTGSYGSHGRVNIALADVDGDSVMDIIYPSRPSAGKSLIVATKGTGELIWTSHDAANAPVLVSISNGAITAANFDDDPVHAEIVVGGMLIDHDGLVHWNEDGNGPSLGSNAGYASGVAVVADLDDDSHHEIITGKHAWKVAWNNTDLTFNVTPYWESEGPDGYPAVADFDGNGTPEVALVASGTLRILEGTTGKLWCGLDSTGQACADDALRTQPIGLPGDTNANRGGPPTIADFDGDGRPEIGVAGGYFYTVFDVNRVSFANATSPEIIDPDLLVQFDVPQPNPGELFVRWKQQSRDLSSNATGSSVFDFQGNGVASVIYGDECFMRSYSGVDGTVELQIMNSTGTVLEYPLVVDVDANGRSEILIVANDVDACSGQIPGYVPRKGLFVYEDKFDQWVRTRSIWNQHAYSIDNILDNGAVPQVQGDSWLNHNTFRSNRQGEIPLNAPDVVVTSLLANANECPVTIYLQATVQNRGTSSIPTGLPVSIYMDGHPTALETKTLGQPIAPGGTLIVKFRHDLTVPELNQDHSFKVVANDNGVGGTFVNECDDTNGQAVVDAVRCDLPL